MASIIRELDYTTAQEHSTPELELPFEAQGDFSTLRITRFYKQTPAGFYQDRVANRVPLGLTLDPEYRGCVLLAVSKPSLTPTGLYAFSRTYGHVPAALLRIRTRTITKPTFPTADYLTYWVDSLVATAPANVWSPAVAVTAVSRYITGGTFTLTYKTSTTAALNWNDSNATIAAAVNALADIVTDGLVVTASNQLTTFGLLTITRSSGTGTINATTMSGTSSLTPANVTENSGFGVTSFYFYVARSAVNCQKTGHGLSASAPLRHLTGTTGGGTLASVYSVVDANNFTIANTSASAPINPTYYRTFVRSYTPGTDRVRVRESQQFYLAGVTPGIASNSDIPVPDSLLNDGALLAAVVNNATGWQQYDASELAPWENTPVQTQTFTEIDLASL